MIHLRKGLLTLALIFVAVITFSQVSITVNVPTAGGFSAALAAAGGDANTVTNLTVTGNINATDIAFMKAMPVLAVLDMENVQVTSNYFPNNAFENKISLISIKLPSSITVIGWYAFKGCSGLSCTLTIPNFVTEIGFEAFRDCSNLTGSLVIPNSVTSINQRAFQKCSGFTGSLTLPNSLTTIEGWTFYDCTGFTGNLIIPNTVTSIDYGAFMDCRGFTGDLIIPNSVVSINENAFMGCSGLNGRLILPNSLKTIREGAFISCSGLTGDLVIPNSVTSIGKFAFSGCSGFKGNLIISNSLSIIKEGTFNGCSGFSLTLSIPSSVKTIEGYAFSNCNGFKGDLAIPNTVVSLGERAFLNCSGFNGRLYISNAIGSISAYTFYGCNGFTGDIIIPNSVVTIESDAFSGCNKFNGNLSIANSVTSIGKNAFYDCTGLIGHLTISNTTITIGESAFYRCYGLTGILTIPNSVNSIGNYAFSGCSGFTGDLNIPNSVQSIGASAFSFCSGLSGKLTIPSSVTSIGSWAFGNSTGIQSISVGIASPLSIDQYTFGSINKTTCTLIVPKGSKTAYQTANFWKDFINITESIFVSFDSQGGTSVSDLNPLYNTTIIAPTPPTRIGFTFGGWYKESGFINEWNFALDKVTDNITLFAKWTISVYTVTFNSQGGSAVASVNANYNSTITAPTTPTLTGYTFGGWFKEAACINAWTFASDVVSANTTLYAKWTINSYTVTFNAQGGTAVASVNANYNTTITAPTAPTRTGYTFWGWYKEAACTNTWTFTSDVVTANTTLYGKWTINTYTVTFNSQGGSAVASINANYNTTITTPTAPTRTGYTFGGWYKETACTNTWTFATDRVMAITTLYAKWTINTYTVTFNAQGGSAVANINANFNTTITAPASPTRIGYDFSGWYKEAACINAWTFASDKVTTNTILYAKWTTYTVTFNSQGGSIVASVNTSFNTTISAPASPDLEGYTFGGWFKEAACTNSWNFANDRVTANTTLYAKWAINTYTVTFNSNGGTPVASVTAVYNTKISEPTPPAKTGYTFDGWYINLSDPFRFNFNLYKITNNTALQAKWIPITYYVTFYSEGIGVNSRGAEYNTPVERPDDPVRTGHIFNGWYKEPTFITPWNFSTDLVTSTMSLYAKWTAITYTVTFNSQGGSSIPNVVVNHGAKVAEPTPPIRNGYTLRGWYDQPTDGFIWFFDYSTVTEDMTLYAYWMINTYTITFDSKGGTPVASVSTEFNSTITAPSAPTRTGYAFVGWYKDEALTTPWNFNSDVVTANATLFAKWSANLYIVSFDSKGGSSVNYIEASYNSTINRPADPTKTGYTFAGWFKDQALIAQWNFSTDVVTSHMYLYAKWTINSYTVTFNTQGGNAITNVTTNYNNTLTAPSTPTRTGYTFAGWYKEASCTNPWAFATDVVTSNITLYAKWTINTFTVTFNTQGANVIPNVSANYNSTITAPSAPARTNYTFDGWYKEASCINVWTFATDVVTADITLYAKWNLSSDIETISGNSFKLYPNPAVSNLTIEGENIEEITIYSLIGAKVLQPVVISKEDKYSFSIDVLESGIYFARIKTSKNKIATIKFMKR